MAGLYIKGMEMPKDKWGYTEIQIWGDGLITTREGKMLTWGKYAIEVPDHGDLIDANTMIGVELYDECREEWYEEAMTVWEYLGRASTANVQIVIPAERSEELL